VYLMLNHKRQEKTERLKAWLGTSINKDSIT